MTSQHRNFIRVTKAIASASLLVCLGASVLLWSWNTVGAELFGAPAAEFRHALAFLLAVLVTAAALAPGRHARHLGMRGTRAS